MTKGRTQGVLTRAEETELFGQPVRDSLGQFKKGNPGRPRHARNFHSEVSRFAKENGFRAVDVLDCAFRGLMKRAAEGSVDAATELLDRFCGKLEGTPAVNIGIGAGALTVGPPIPDTRALGEYLNELVGASRELLQVEIGPVASAGSDVEELLE